MDQGDEIKGDEGKDARVKGFSIPRKEYEMEDLVL